MQFTPHFESRRPSSDPPSARSGGRGLGIAALCLLGTLLASSVGAQQSVIVFLTTLYEPVTEAGFAYVTVSDDDGIVLHAEEIRLDTGMDLASGARLTEVPGLPQGLLFVEVTLYTRDLRFLGQRAAVLTLRDNPFAVSILIPRPEGEASKTGELLDDHDGNGVISNGDVVRYTVSIKGGLARFSDPLSEDLTLIVGSVQTTSGEITFGNGLEDDRVQIDGAGGDVTVVYDALVHAMARNQGTAVIESLGTFLYLPTDDPSTPEVGDMTLLEVQCTASADLEEDLLDCEAKVDRLEGELADSEQALDAARAERDQLQDQLDEVLDDADGDGVPAIADLCPRTPHQNGVPARVDASGCSQAEFCSAIDLSGKVGTSVCNQADWMNDEPGSNPADCTATRARTCVPRSLRL